MNPMRHMRGASGKVIGIALGLGILVLEDGCISETPAISTMSNVDMQVTSVRDFNDVVSIDESVCASEDAMLIYQHLLASAGQGNGKVDVVLARLTAAKSETRLSQSFLREFCEYTRRTPELSDLIWQYLDWYWTHPNREALHDVNTDGIARGSDLEFIFERCCGASQGRPISQGEQVLAIQCFAAMTQQYEILKDNGFDDLVSQFGVRKETLQERLIYYRFDESKRVFLFDGNAYQARTPVDEICLEVSGFPSGPGPDWNDEFVIAD